MIALAVALAVMLAVLATTSTGTGGEAPSAAADQATWGEAEWTAYLVNVGLIPAGTLDTCEFPSTYLEPVICD